MENEFVIESKLENICKVEKLIDDISEENNISSDIYGKILIASIEAVNNSIVHGNKLDPNKKVKLNMFVSESQLHVIVEDEGRGFDYNNVPDPTTPENIENISGRGVFLMKKLADAIQFNEKGTRVEMIFNI